MQGWSVRGTGIGSSEDANGDENDFSLDFFHEIAILRAQ